jgi:hypothetical protein
MRERPNGPRDNVLSVGKRLLKELRGRPAKADAVAVTDGTAPGDDEDEEDEGEG